MTFTEYLNQVQPQKTLVVTLQPHEYTITPCGCAVIHIGGEPFEYQVIDGVFYTIKDGATTGKRSVFVQA